MRTPLLLSLLLAASASPARAAHPFVDVQTAASNGSGLVFSTEGGTSFDKERYRISARVKTTRLGDEAPGTREEYLLRFTRELYFVTVAGRLGTSPPNSQGAGYHLAGGEAWFKFYGTDLAPEHPEISDVIWESSGPVPDPAKLDRTWITRVGGVYTNVNNHIQTANGLYILVEGAWQFSVLETYREMTTFGVQGGGNRYNKSLDGTTPLVLQSVVDYWGNYLPLTGWPNNWQSLRGSRRFGAFEVGAAGTRINMLDGASVTTAALEGAWTASAWTLHAALERATRSGTSARTGLALGASRRW